MSKCLRALACLFLLLNPFLVSAQGLDSVMEELDALDKKSPPKAKQTKALKALEDAISFPIAEIAGFSEINERYTKYVAFIEQYQASKPIEAADLLVEINKEEELQQLASFLGHDVPCLPLSIVREGTYQVCDIGEKLAFIASDGRRIPLAEPFKELTRTALWALYLQRLDPEFTEDIHAMLSEAAADIRIVVSILSNASGIYESFRSKSVLGINAVTVINYATGGVIGPTIQLFMYHLQFWNEPLQLLSEALNQADRDLAGLRKQIISVKETKSISVEEADKNVTALLSLDKQFVSFIKKAVEQQGELRELSRKISDISQQSGLTFIATGSELVDQLNFYIGNIITSISAYQRPVGDVLESLATIPQEVEEEARIHLHGLVKERQLKTEPLSEILIKLSGLMQARGFPICRGEFTGALRTLAKVKAELVVCREQNIDACFRSLTKRETVLATLKPEDFLNYANCSLERVSLEESVKQDFQKNITTIVNKADPFFTEANITRYGQALDSVLQKPDEESSSILYWLLFAIVFTIVFFFLRKWSENIDDI